MTQQDIPRRKRRRANSSLRKMMEVLEPFLSEPEMIEEVQRKDWKLLLDHRAEPAPKGAHCEAI